MASSRRSGALALGLALLLPAPLPAQARPFVLSGTLVRLGARDTTAIAGAWVVAHRVGERRQGPVDSVRSDGAGRFRFGLPRPDSGTVYVVSARWQGIGYFSDPVTAASPAGPLVLAVFDTTVAGPPLTVGDRHVVVTRGTGGARRILDIVQVENAGSATRVGADSTAVVWSTALPAGAVRPTAGESDVPATALRFEDGRAAVTAPFPPGAKQVVITYDLPGEVGRLVIPIEHPTARLEFLVEDSTATASAGLEAGDPVAIEGRTFRRFARDSARAGERATVTFGGPASDPRRLTWVAVLAAALLLAGGAGWALRRRPAAPPGDTATGEASAVGDASPERLAALVAALDDRFAGREASTPAEAWAEYQRRRTALKEALAQHVARTTRPRTDS